MEGIRINFATIICRSREGVSYYLDYPEASCTQGKARKYFLRGIDRPGATRHRLGTAAVVSRQRYHGEPFTSLSTERY